MLASSKHKYSKILAFPDTYYELIINVLQSVELFCAYERSVICKDLIRGLPLLNQWRYDLVFLMELVLGHIYSRTRRYQQFTIFSVSSTAVVIVFMCNRAVIYLFHAAILLSEGVITIT